VKYSNAGLFCALLFLIGCSPAPEIQITDYGIYRKTSVGDPVLFEGTNDEYLKTGDAEHLEFTRDIPAKKGLVFGFNFVIKGVPKAKPLKLDIVRYFPEMKSDDGSSVTSDTFWIRYDPSPSGEIMDGDYFAFEHDYELVEGEWIIQYYWNGTLLTEQVFNTFVPGS
jgi:hypothetical protein